MSEGTPASGAAQDLPADYRPASDALAGRNILITGASDGIGRAAALAFAAHGATVVLLGRTVRKLEAVYDRIVVAGHPQPGIYPMNLEGAAYDDYLVLAETLERELGHLDGLLHNAAELGTPAPLAHYDPQTWARVFQVNVHAPFLMTRACLPLLLRSEDASILFTSDEMGRRGRAYWGAYGVSKFAVEGMMQTLADEMASYPNLRVNSMDPGPMRTRLRARAYPGERPDALPDPEGAMGHYVYLMGPDGRGLTGRALSLRLEPHGPAAAT